MRPHALPAHVHPAMDVWKELFADTSRFAVVEVAPGTDWNKAVKRGRHTLLLLQDGEHAGPVAINSSGYAVWICAAEGAYPKLVVPPEGSEDENEGSPRNSGKTKGKKKKHHRRSSIHADGDTKYPLFAAEADACRVEGVAFDAPGSACDRCIFVPKGSALELYNCEVCSDGEGIVCNGHLKADNCHFTRSHGAAVVVSTSSKASVSVGNSSIFGAKDFGVLVDANSQANIVGNSIRGCGVAGVVVGGASAPTLEDNNIVDCGCGVVFEGETTARLTGGKITTCSTGILAVNKARPTIEGVNVVKSKRLSLEVSGRTDVSVSRCQMTAGQTMPANAIFAEGCKGVVAETTFSGGRFGNIVCDGYTTVLFTKNKMNNLFGGTAAEREERGVDADVDGGAAFLLGHLQASTCAADNIFTDYSNEKTFISNKGGDVPPLQQWTTVGTFKEPDRRVGFKSATVLTNEAAGQEAEHHEPVTVEIPSGGEDAGSDDALASPISIMQLLAGASPHLRSSRDTLSMSVSVDRPKHTSQSTPHRASITPTDTLRPPGAGEAGGTVHRGTVHRETLLSDLVQEYKRMQAQKDQEIALLKAQLRTARSMSARSKGVSTPAGPEDRDKESSARGASKSRGPTALVPSAPSPRQPHKYKWNRAKIQDFLQLRIPLREVRQDSEGPSGRDSVAAGCDMYASWSQTVRQRTEERKNREEAMKQRKRRSRLSVERQAKHVSSVYDEPVRKIAEHHEELIHRYIQPVIKERLVHTPESLAYSAHRLHDQHESYRRQLMQALQDKYAPPILKYGRDSKSLNRYCSSLHRSHKDKNEFKEAVINLGEKRVITPAPPPPRPQTADDAGSRKKSDAPAFAVPMIRPMSSLAPQRSDAHHHVGRPASAMFARGDS